METASTTESRRGVSRTTNTVVRRGFTLPEVIVGVSLLGLFMFMAVGLVRAAKRLLPVNAVSINGAVLPIAPSPGAFADSVKLHGAFLERLGAARAVYVFGGSHQGLPSGASRLSGKPLAAERLPMISSFAAGLPQDAYAFQQTYSAQVGPIASDASAADFSVLVVGPWNGQLAVTALIQVRERRVSLEDQETPAAWVRRDTTLYDISGDTWSSAFVEKAEVAAKDAVGARHFWYRYDEGRVAEEGPVVAVFPDPWLYAGSRISAREQPPPFSRFTYVLSVNP